MTTVAESISSYRASLMLFFQDIKFKHSIFAFPFAAVAFLIGEIPLPSILQSIALIICMISARSWAMGMNRLLDRGLDRRNPRTKLRLMASGQLSLNHAKFILGLCAVVFIFASFSLNSIAGILSIPMLAILASYSLLKKYTWFCHYYLGLCLGMAPIAVSIAIKGQVEPVLYLVGLGITFWTAGFDILYSLQDQEIDKTEGLFSIPSRFGERNARILSRLNFVMAVLFLIGVGISTGQGIVYFTGLIFVSYLLLYQHILLGWDSRMPARLENMGKAFFDSNAMVSIIYFSFTLVDKYWL